MPTPNEIFTAMPERFKADQAGDLNTTIQFDLSGEDGGKWAVVIEDGQVRVEEGLAENPDATVHMSADDYVAMTTGQLNPVNAFMMGKVKVEGDLGAVMKLQTLFM